MKKKKLLNILGNHKWKLLWGAGSGVWGEVFDKEIDPSAPEKGVVLIYIGEHTADVHFEYSNLNKKVQDKFAKQVKKLSFLEVYFYLRINDQIYIV